MHALFLPSDTVFGSLSKNLNSISLIISFVDPSSTMDGESSFLFTILLVPDLLAFGLLVDWFGAEPFVNSDLLLSNFKRLLFFETLADTLFRFILKMKSTLQLE